MGVANGAPLAALLAWDAVSSLGESAAETALLLRAGLTNVGPSRFIDATGERVLACSAPAVAADISGVERAAALAQLALRRLEPLSETARKAVLLIALPERYGAGEITYELSREGKSFVQLLRARLPRGLSGIEIEAFPFGRAAGAVAMRRALELVGSDRLVIWGGVETLYDWTVIEALQKADRLLTLDNVDGIRPGEAAAFVAVVPPRTPGTLGVIAIGTGREPCPIGSDKPSQSLGLTAALEAAVAPLRAARQRTNCWLLDNSHEAYATQELQNVIARFGDVLGLQAELQMPLKELGDVGAAAMPLLAVLGAEAWRLGYASDETAVITGCSQHGPRGALLLGGPARQPHPGTFQ